MHELSLVRTLLEHIDRLIVDQGASRLCAVYLQVGEFSGVEPDLLKIAFHDSMAFRGQADVALQVELVPLLARCLACDHRFHVFDFVFQCPQCACQEVEIVAGQELLLDRIEVEHEG